MPNLCMGPPCPPFSDFPDFLTLLVIACAHASVQYRHLSPPGIELIFQNSSARLISVIQGLWSKWNGSPVCFCNICFRQLAAGNADSSYQDYFCTTSTSYSRLSSMSTLLSSWSLNHLLYPFKLSWLLTVIKTVSPKENPIHLRWFMTLSSAGPSALRM